MDDHAGSTSYNAVAALPSGDAARAAADALRRSGFAEDRVSVSGDADDRPAEPERRERDRRTGRRTRRTTWLWAGVGVVAGAILGVIAALAFSDTGVTGIAVFGVAGAIVGGLIGGLVAGIGSLEDTRPSEASVVPENGRRSIVGVAAETREDVDRAVQILRRSGATAIDVFDPAGNRVSAA
jgi:hypothetical protein